MSGNTTYLHLLYQTISVSRKVLKKRKKMECLEYASGLITENI